MPFKPIFHQMPRFGIISPGVRESFLHNGLLVFRGFYTTSEVNRLRKRVEQMVRNYQPDPADAADPEVRLRAAASSTSFFLAADSFGADGQPTCSKMRAVAEIGCAMHDQDPVFSSFFRREQLLTMSFLLGMKKPLLARSRCLFNRSLNGKAPVAGQNASVLFTEPESAICCWIVMEDSRPDCGCLQVAVGGHRGPLRRRLRQVDGRLSADELDGTPLPECDTRLMLGAGSMVVMHGRLPHFCARNQNSYSCLAAAVDIIDGECRYPDDNWLQRDADLPMQGFSPDPERSPDQPPPKRR